MGDIKEDDEVITPKGNYIKLLLVMVEK